MIAAIAGCGRLGFDGQAGDAGSGNPGDGAFVVGDSASGDTASGGGAMGSGTISGLPPVGLFPSVMAAYVVAHPKVAGQTAIYLFSKPITCAQLGAANWPRSLPALTNILELELAGSSIATYQLMFADPPSAPNGFAQERYALGNGEQTDAASAGMVQVSGMPGDGSVQGSFSVAWFIGGLTGTYDAAYCPTGVSP